MFILSNDARLSGFSVYFDVFEAAFRGTPNTAVRLVRCLGFGETQKKTLRVKCVILSRQYN